MARFAFTFGVAYNLGNNYAVVEADSWNEARETFVAARAAAGELPDSGRRWSTQYFEDEIERLIERHGLTEVPIDTPIRWRDPANPVE